MSAAAERSWEVWDRAKVVTLGSRRLLVAWERNERGTQKGDAQGLDMVTASEVLIAVVD
jgi:hypothetical protein